MRYATLKTLTGSLFATKGGALPAQLPTQNAPTAVARRPARRADPSAPVRISLPLDADTHLRLMQAARRTGTTLEDVMLGALGDYMTAESAAFGGCACFQKTGD